jgi:hypothetical protein
MLILFCINLVKHETVWLVGKRELHSFSDTSFKYWDIRIFLLQVNIQIFTMVPKNRPLLSPYTIFLFDLKRTVHRIPCDDILLGRAELGEGIFQLDQNRRLFLQKTKKESRSRKVVGQQTKYDTMTIPHSRLIFPTKTRGRFGSSNHSSTADWKPRSWTTNLLDHLMNRGRANETDTVRQEPSRRSHSYDACPAD